jgi:hypothetical protein
MTLNDMSTGNMDCFLIDLVQNPMGQTIRVGLPRRGTPTYFDGRRVLWIEEKLNGNNIPAQHNNASLK